MTRPRTAATMRPDRAARWATSQWPRAAVFDCDGLLVDSAACWHRAYAELCHLAGRTIEDIDVDALAGASVAGAAPQLRRQLGHRIDAAQLKTVLAASFAADPPPPLPGAHAIVRALQTRIPLAVASNAPREIVHEVLGHQGLGDAFAAVVSSDDVVAGKPAPDVYIEALHRLRVHPSDAVAFEDSPRGAKAARAAGLVVIGVPSAQGLRLEADLVVARLDDPRLLGLLGLAA